MIEVYKIVHGLYDVSCQSILKLRNQTSQRVAMRQNDYQLYYKRAEKNLRKYSFPIRVVNIWNNLPNYVVKAPSLNSFKNRLDKLWSDQEMLYNPNATLNRRTYVTDTHVKVDELEALTNVEEEELNEPEHP